MDECGSRTHNDGFGRETLSLSHTEFPATVKEAS